MKSLEIKLKIPLNSGRVFNATFISPNPLDHAHFDPFTDNLSDDQKNLVLDGKAFYFIVQGELSSFKSKAMVKFGQQDFFESANEWKIPIVSEKVMQSRNSNTVFDEDMRKTSVKKDFERLLDKPHFKNSLNNLLDEYDEEIVRDWIVGKPKVTLSKT
jgi:hypothetical protein